MPLYVYHCDAHGDFEVLRRLGKAKESEPCKKCGRVCFRDYGREVPGHRPFVGYWTEALYPKPTFIGTKAKEKAACARIGVERVS
jgi:putative FmdB family regulatory protein